MSFNMTPQTLSHTYDVGQELWNTLYVKVIFQGELPVPAAMQTFLQVHLR
jgi:hypothetical protein